MLRKAVKTYGIALAAVVAAVFVRWLLDPWLDDYLPLVTLFGAVAFAVYAAGFRPALLITVIGYLACNWLFLPPKQQFSLGLEVYLGLLGYMISCAAIIILGENMRRARFRAEALNDDLRQEVTRRREIEAEVRREIEERKRNEIALREISQRLKIVTDSMAAPVTRCSRDLRYVWVNQSYAEWLGRKTEEIVGRPIVEIVGQPAFDHLLPYFERVLAGEVVRYEEQVDFRGIGRRWITAVYTPTINEKGECDGWVAVVNDIDDRKRMEEGLRESELRFHTLADSAPVHIWMDDEHGNTIFGNARYMEYTGTGLEQLSKQIWPDILHSEDKERYLSEYKTALAAEAGFRAEVRLRRHDEAYSWFQIIGSPRFQGERFAGYIGISMDVTARIDAERGIRADLEAMTLLQEVGNLCAAKDSDFQQCLLRILDVAIAFTAAQKGTLQLFNDKSGTLRLIAHKGFEEPFLRFFDTVNARDAAACGEAMRSRDRIIVEDVRQSAIFAGEPSLDVLLHAGIRAVQSTPLASSAGSLIGMISTHFLSPQRPSNRQLRLMDLLAREAADYLERKRAEDLLREYVQQLAEADRRKDEFLATLAHELRNPLAPISNAVQMLKEIGYTDPDLVENQELIERQVQNMVRLLDDLLDVSRITSNKLELRKTAVTLASVVQTAIETSRSHIRDGAHELSVSLPTEPVYIEADPIRLAQVFSNLLNNAAKFTREGGHIWLSAERQDNEITVSVKDNGIGIEPEILPRLFEMFSQAESLYERSHEGLGIGLWLVKGLVEMHGGTITVRSGGLGKGSEFSVRLPVITNNVTAESKPTNDNDESQRNKFYRILVVDDRKNAADILAKLLKKKGHDVQTAYDGKNGLLVAEQFRPEVVLLDIGMPDMNGYEVCRQIRSQPWGEAMYLIAVSGWGQEEDRRRSAGAGFDYHFVKPVHSTMLTKVLDSISTKTPVNTGNSPTATL